MNSVIEAQYDFNSAFNAELDKCDNPNYFIKHFRYLPGVNTNPFLGMGRTTVCEGYSNQLKIDAKRNTYHVCLNISNVALIHKGKYIEITTI